MTKTDLFQKVGLDHSASEWFNFSLPEMYPVLGTRSMTKTEVDILLESFKTDPYPRKEEKNRLAESLNISRRKIELWFSNMRKKKGVLKKSEYIMLSNVLPGHMQYV